MRNVADKSATRAGWVRDGEQGVDDGELDRWQRVVNTSGTQRAIFPAVPWNSGEDGDDMKRLPMKRWDGPGPGVVSAAGLDARAGEKKVTRRLGQSGQLLMNERWMDRCRPTVEVVCCVSIILMRSLAASLCRKLE